MNAKEIRDIPQDLLVRLGEERNKAPDGEELKPDYIQAAVPLPGGGNNLLVFGRNGTELWQADIDAN